MMPEGVRAEMGATGPVAQGYPGFTLPLRRHAVQRAREAALIDGDRTLAWAQFEDRVAHLAGALQAMGVERGARVAILSQNSLEMAESLFAALWLGAIAYPVNHRLAVPELISQFRECTPAVLVAHRDFGDIVGRLDAECPPPGGIVSFGDGEAGGKDYETLIEQSSRIADAGARGDDVAVLVYTGGTTGRSKGAMITHANLWANTLNVNLALGITSASRYMLASPLFHVAALARLFSTAAAGAGLVFLRRFSSSGALETIERHRVAVTTLVPTMLKAVVDDPDLAKYDLSSLKIISYGAAPSDETLLRNLLERLPHVDLWQAYGMTELSPTATQLGPEHHRDVKLLRSAGRAAPLCEVRVAGEDDAALPNGQIGEVLVRGPNVMKGYWNKPELTSRALRGGWMHTGDLGYLDDDGFLYVVDRKDDMIISGGENVYTTEVENAIASHPRVRQCVVIGVADEKWGQRVHAIVVPAGAEAPELDDIQAHCRSMIAGYKLPRSLEVRTEPLPLSGANKVLKTLLREEAERRLKMAAAPG